MKETTIEVKRDGVVALIRPTPKQGVIRYIVDYRLKGQRKLLWRSTLEKAREAANDALDKIADGDADTLELTATDCHMFVRSRDALAGTGRPVDLVCLDYAEMLRILDGRTTPIEAIRDWVKQNLVSRPKISVADAVSRVQEQSVADGKSKARQHELDVILNQFAANFNCEVHAITPSMISSYLTGLARANDSTLPLGERSKRNHKDVIKHLNTWLVLHGYLAKGTNWMEGVQKYSKRKQGDITIYTPAELKLILTEAAKPAHRSKWMVGFCAISAFSTIRHSEIKRLDWKQVELSDKPGESFIEILPVATTKSAGRRRFIPINETLKAWLKTCKKPSGKVVPVTDSYTLLSRLIASAGVSVKPNALRHSSISYCIAQSGDIARVADESGNSVAMIHANYLRRVKPAQAEEWFGILPATPKLRKRQGAARSTAKTPPAKDQSDS